MKNHPPIHPVFCWLLLVLLLPAPRASAQKVPLKITNYPIPTTGTVIYAAPEDASNPGVTTNTGTSPDSPWTLTKALLSTPPNATVVVRGGEYRSVSQNRITNKITVQAYPGEEPWIKGSTVVTDWEKVVGADAWVHANWPHEFPRTTVPQDIGTNPLCDNGDMVYVNDQSLTQVDALEKVGAGKFYVDYEGDKLYVGTDPASGRVESTRYASPIARRAASGAEVRVPNGTAIKGIGFTHYADDGLEVVCAGGLSLENNTFAWNGEAGAALVAPTAVVSGNTFAFNGKVGLMGNNLRETAVEYNHAYQNNVENYSLSWGAAGIKVIATKKMYLKHNRIENNNSTGIWLDISAIDNEVSYNRVGGNRGFGVFSELSNGTLIAGNLFVDNRNYGIALSDADSSEVWNNTIVSNTNRGIFVKDTPRESKDVQPGSTFYNYIFSNRQECTWITRANVIKNNLVVTNTGLWMENTQPSGLQVRESDFNGYYRTAAAGGDVYRWGGVNYRTLDAFKAAVPGYERNSIAFYRPVANPFFSDTTYQLKANSPAIRAGTPLPARIAVLLGLPANNQPVDLGARQGAARQTPTIAYNTGADRFTSASGQVYEPDDYVTGGSFYEAAQLTIAGTDDDRIYQSERFGDFRYAIPLTNGTYDLTFKFAELYWENPGLRVFDVVVEGVEVITDLDIYARVGALAALDIIRNSTVADDTLNIEFKTDLDNAQLCGLLVTAAAPATASARVSAADASVAVFPNPVADQLKIQFQSEKAGPVRVRLTNALGQVRLQFVQNAAAGANQLSLRVDELENGVHYLTVDRGGRQEIKRIIIAH